MRLLYFYMKTCKQCRRQTEELDKNATDYEIERIDCESDEAPALMRRYRVGDAPTIIALNDEGQVVIRWVDFTKFSVIEAELKRRF